jgi:hypothetical protein
LPDELVLLRIKAASGEMEDHGVASLKFRQRTSLPGLVDELVVGEVPSFSYVVAHVTSRLETR